MSKTDIIINALDLRVARRDERRRFFKVGGGFAVGAIGGAVLGACSSSSDTAVAQAPPAGAANLDVEILNFALQLEYLEAQFYSFAAFGTGLAQSSLSGTGTQGGVIGGRQVAFSDPLVRRYANEIAKDEIAHVNFLRTVLGSAAVAQPAIDVGGTDPNGAFSSAARAAGLVGPGVAFDPYLNDNNFLLGAFIFEDVGVTLYKGASPLITSKVFLEAAAGLLAAEAYHASIVRTTLSAKGIATPSLLTSADAISNARDSLDGTTDLDQGISPIGAGSAQESNIFPSDSNALAFSRTVAQGLNIVYLKAGTGQTSGGFFPAGLNGPPAFRTT
ncbi:ferritin-like domain-containing protein [Brevundimonas sp. TWP2-3-2]|uniref:ferritin-like domain-containing protein n=1 Tax=unclassified Brevundimonas TaxID=2622653 RepID=UPI003CF50147